MCIVLYVVVVVILFEDTYNIYNIVIMYNIDLHVYIIRPTDKQ
jgi:hypothetical protein